MYDNNFYISVDGITDTLIKVKKFDFDTHEGIKKL